MGFSGEQPLLGFDRACDYYRQENDFFREGLPFAFVEYCGSLMSTTENELQIEAKQPLQKASEQALFES